MADWQDYKGIEVPEATPTGAGGLRLKDDLMELADRAANFSSTGPETSDGVDGGYGKGSLWFNTTNETMWVCVNPGTEGMNDADWKSLYKREASAIVLAPDTDGSVQVDNLQLDGNTLSATDTNGDITVTPDGTGNVVLDGLNWPNADGSANEVLSTDGAGSLSWALPGGLTITSTKTANYTASDGDHVVCDSAAAVGNFTITLPASPSAGNKVRVTLIKDDTTRVVDIGRNSSNINGGTDESKWRLVLEGDTVLFTYVGSDCGWQAEDGIQAADAAVRATTDQTGFLTDTFTKIEFDTEDWNRACTVSLANERITVRREGEYSIFGNYTLSDDAVLYINITINGTYTYRTFQPQETSTGLAYVAAACRLQLAVGDYVEIFGYQRSSATKSVENTDVYNQARLSIREER